MTFDDTFFNPGWFDEEEIEFFSFNENIIDDVKRKEGYVGGIYIGMDSDLKRNQRMIYNFLDFLGDIGGLKESLSLLGWFFISLLGQGGDM